MKKLLALVSLYSNIAAASPLPPNDLWKEDNLYELASMGEQEFSQLINEVAYHYAPVIEKHGAKLVLEKNWKDSTVNAYASQSGSTWTVAMFGGLARRPEVSKDGFQMVVCHELGHHLAGFAFYGNNHGEWAASEGQSDYFSTHACARKLWGKKDNTAYRALVDSAGKEKCDSVHSDSREQELCYRSTHAGMSLATLLARLGGERDPQPDTPDQRKVPKTQPQHPRGQCRLDTYIAGALCKTPFDILKIPGRKHAEGQESKAAQDEAMKYSCESGEGARPACWFALKP